MEIVKSKMANALTSADSNHIIAVAGDVYDEDLGMYQSELNENVSKGYVYDVEGEEWVPNTPALPVASVQHLGGIKLGFLADTLNPNNRDYPVKVDMSGKAYVTVPWEYNAIPTASDTVLGGVMTGVGTGVKVEGRVIKADFDITNYSEVGDITKHTFSTNTVASPDTVKQIMESYNQVFLDTLGDVEAARLNLYNAIYGTNYTDPSEIP